MTSTERPCFDLLGACAWQVAAKAVKYKVLKLLGACTRKLASKTSKAMKTAQQWAEWVGGMLIAEGGRAKERMED